jgi:hypothetical protein
VIGGSKTCVKSAVTSPRSSNVRRSRATVLVKSAVTFDGPAVAFVSAEVIAGSICPPVRSATS